MKKIFILTLAIISIPCFAWDILRNQKGGLTGYSTPIAKDIYKQLGIDPNDANQRLKSPNVMTDLFSAPQINYNQADSRDSKQSGSGGISAKTGVTIIYD